VISFATIRIFGGPPAKTFLLVMSVFVAVAGLWLGVMENILKHSGYIGRSIIAAALLIQGLATLLWIAFDGRALFRALLGASAISAGFLGFRALRGILSAPHFEGFVFIIGIGLLLQSALTIATLLTRRDRRTT
jgi:hypothetical protein